MTIEVCERDVQRWDFFSTLLDTSKSSRASLIPNVYETNSSSEAGDVDERRVMKAEINALLQLILFFLRAWLTTLWYWHDTLGHLWFASCTTMCLCSSRKQGEWWDLLHCLSTFCLWVWSLLINHILAVSKQTTGTSLGCDETDAVVKGCYVLFD